MDSDKEYLSLPHGMFDRDSKWVKRERNILLLHDKCGESIACNVKKYSPVGYSSTFERSANTTSDKVYKFMNKTGKSLTLSCDSTPNVFREYVTTMNGEASRVSFVAPLFRYRNSHTRNFTQIGYAIINEKKENNENDFLYLAQLVQAMVSLFKGLNLETKLYINNYQALREILINYIPLEELPDILYQLQFAENSGREKILKEKVTDKDICETLINILTSASIKIDKDISEKDLSWLPKEYSAIYKVAQTLERMTGDEVYLNLRDLHSIETIDNYAVRFKTIDGVSLGDGGEYTNYALNFNDKIKSFWSVASGVEVLERNMPIDNEKNPENRIAIFNIDSSIEFVTKVLVYLNNSDYQVSYKGITKDLGKSIRKAKNEYTDIVILGKNEETENKIKIKSLISDKTLEIDIKN